MGYKGTYMHFKGKEYEVIGEAYDKYNNQFILYRQLYGNNEFWIRPKEMFFGENNMGIKRFDKNGEPILMQVDFEELDKKYNLLPKEYQENLHPEYAKHSETQEKYRVFFMNTIGPDIYLVVKINNIGENIT